MTLLASGWANAPARTRLDGMEVHRTGRRFTFNLMAPYYYRKALADQHFDIMVEDLNKVPLYTPLWARHPLALIVHHLFGRTAFQEASLPVALATVGLERPLGRIYREVPVMAVSQSTADDLVRRGLHRDRIRVVPNGVDLTFYSPAEGSRFARPTLLYLGRLKRYKRIDLILRVVARLRDRIRLRCVIAGSGDHAAPLRALVTELGLADTVEMPGRVSDEEKRRLFRGAWVHLLTSPKEGWGITNLEAAACGTPTVASDSPGLRDSVVDGETGYLVPHGDMELLTERVARILESQPLRDRLGAGARAFAERFTWDRTADGTLAVLEAGLGVDGRANPTEVD